MQCKIKQLGFMCSEFLNFFKFFFILAGQGADSKDSAGEQYAHGEDIAHHDDNWES